MIVQKDKSNTIIKSYPSLDEASKDTKIAKSDIKRVTLGQRKTTGGFIFEEIENKLPFPFLGGNPDNVLFVGDLHAPWMLEGYIEWCREQQERYNCGTVIFAGDILDSNAWSYHEKDADGMSVKEELNAAKEQLKKVFQLFPTAISLLGNHDLLIKRKAKTIGLSQEFLKDFNEIIGAPKTWSFVNEYVKDNVMYIHGSVGDAFKRATESRISTCQGHLHTKTFVQWSVSEKDAIFGLQIGGGFDRRKYAFDYAKEFPKKPVISCGVILENGKLPFVKLMPL